MTEQTVIPGLARTRVGKACYSCDDGVFIMGDLKGRRFPYREMEDVLFTESLKLPICDKCGDFLVGGRVAQDMDRILEPEYMRRREEVETRMTKAGIELLGAPMKDLFKDDEE